MFEQIEKYVGLYCLALVFTVAVGLATMELIQGQPLNPLVQDTLYSGIIVAAHSIGVQVGKGTKNPPSQGGS